MQLLKVKVSDSNGRHLRPAAKIVEKIQEYKSHIVISNGDKHAEGSSVLELMLLGAGHNSHLDIRVSGEDEADAAKGIAELFQDGAGI